MFTRSFPSVRVSWYLNHMSSLVRVARDLQIFAKSADLNNLVQKYMSMLNLDTPPHIKVQNNLGARALGTCRWVPTDITSTIIIQKVALGDPTTLERILAHEMAHHAVFLDNIKDLQDLAREHGPAAGPPINNYLRRLRVEETHGEPWLKYVKIINSHMGNDFVTITSDQSYVEDQKVKPYYVLIAVLPNGKYGWQIGVSLSAKMKQMIDRMGQAYGAKLIKTTDAKWQNGPRIGSSKFATSPDKQEDLKRLHSEAD